MATSQQLRRQIKELLAGGTVTAGDGSVIGGATTAKQDQMIALLTQLVNGTSTQTPLVPSLQIVTTSGTIPAGAKFVSIGVKGTGTVLGASIESVAVIEFPYVVVGYGEIDYTIDPGGEFIIVSGR